jgi:signal transduction histidine kinase
MLALNLDRLRANMTHRESHACKRAGELYEEVRALGQHVSGISHRLHSSKLEFFGLATAAASFCKEISDHHGISVEFVHANVPPTLPEGVAINLFRVLQEALSNAVKHSGTSRCHVSLRGTDDGLQLEVRDEGRGIRPRRRPDGVWSRPRQHAGAATAGRRERGDRVATGCRHHGHRRGAAAPQPRVGYVNG